MAVGSNLLIYSTLLVATRFLVLHSLIYRTDYMCNHDHFILQATGAPYNFEHSAWKIFKPNIAGRPSILGRTSKFRSSRYYTGFNRLNGQEKLWPGIEPTTFGLDLRRSTDWSTRSDGSRPWELKMLKSRQWTCTSTRKGYVYTNERFSLSLCGPISISRANAHMVHMG